MILIEILKSYSFIKNLIYLHCTQNITHNSENSSFPF